MTMPSFEQVHAAAEDRAPFANGTEGEAWVAGWCAREDGPCRHDDIDRGGSLSCPLLEVALSGGTPAQWVDPTSALGPKMYRCTEYEAER